MNGKSPAYFLHNLQKLSTNTELTLTRPIKTRYVRVRDGMPFIVGVLFRENEGKERIEDSDFGEYSSFGRAFHIQIQHEAEITSCNDNNAVYS